MARKYFFKYLLVIFLTLFLAEGLLRLSYIFIPKVRYFLYSTKYDLDLSRLKTPNDLRENAPCPLIPYSKVNGFVISQGGLYTPKYELEKKDESLVRIGLIGDSFLIGVVPYPENFVNVLQRRVQENLVDRKIEVINWGMPCLGPQYEEKVSQILGFPAKPDYLIWTFFVGNDFTDERVPGDSLSLPNLMAKNFYTVRFVRNLQKSWQGNQLGRETSYDSARFKDAGGTYLGAEEPYSAEKETFPLKTYLKIESEKLVLFNPKFFPESSWGNTQKIMRRFKEDCDLNGIKCLVVIAPDEIQVNNKLRKDVLDFSKLNEEEVMIDYPQSLLEGFFQSNGIPFLNLLPAFQKRGQEETLYQPNDTHWNLKGNDLAAQEIFSFWERIR